MFRLAALVLAFGVVQAETGPPEPRLVWGGRDVTLLGGPSRDGRFISFVDPVSHELSLRELATGKSRALTRKADGSREFAYFSVISPDSRRVAYAWFNEEGFYDLRVIDVDGSNQRTLYRNEEAGFVQPCAWSADGSRILTLLFRADNISQITLVPSDGGPPKILRSLNWVYPKRMDLSPDGRFIVYDSFYDESSGDRAIYLLSVDGSKERKLLGPPGSHVFPLWMPDGKRIVYASDRAGTMDAWELTVETGEQRVLRRDLGRVLPMGIASSGELFYGVRAGLTDVFISTLVDPVKSAKRASLQFPGRNSAPAWSPDGKSLAYLSRRGSENFGQESRAIVIRNGETEREIAPKLAHIERVRWSPGGGSLLVSGSDNKGRAGLYEVEVATGALKSLVTEAGGSFRGIDGLLCGKTLYTIRDGALFRGESRVQTVPGVKHLAASPDGNWLAAATGKSILLIPSAGGETTTLVFEGATELQWGRDLFAAKGAGLWRVPLDGSAPVAVDTPGNRDPGFSLHSDGERIALTAGNARSEIWVLPLK